MSAAEVSAEIRDAMRRILPFFDAEHCALFEVKPDTGEVELQEAVEPAGSNRTPASFTGGERFPWLFERCIRRGMVVRLDRMSDLPAEAETDRGSLSDCGVRSLLVIPLPSTNGVGHLICVAALNTERSWPEEDTARLRLLGETFVSALQRKAMKDMERGTLRFEELIADLSARFVGGPLVALDEEVLAALCEIREFFSVDLCGIFEVDWSRDETYLRYVSSAPGIVPPPTTVGWAQRVPWKYERIIKQGQTLEISRSDFPPEASADRSWYEAIGVQSSVSIPLFVGGRVRYVLSLATNRGDQRWPARYVKRLQVLGDTVVTALNVRNAIEALRAAQHGLVEAQRVGNLGSWEWNIVSDAFDASYHLECILGCRPATFQALMSIVHPADRSALEEAIERGLAQAGRRSSLQYRICRPDGQERVLDNWYEVICPQDGSSPRVIGTVQDITEKRRTELELQSLRMHYWHADRISRLGVMMASLAHELSQPLAAILSNAQAGLRFLATGTLQEGEMGEILRDIVADDKRASEIIAGLRAMLRRRQPEQTRVDAGEAVQEVLALLRGELLAQQIRVEASCEASYPVLFDRTQMQQVLMNLILNSVDAMRQNPFGQRHLALEVSSPAPDAVLVSVADSGIGIPSQELQRVFDAFWTTKEGGLGMGLALCRSIVESHGGRIWAESDGSRGTKVSFQLPAAR